MAAAHLFVKPVTYTVSRFFESTRPAGRSAEGPCGARVVRWKKKRGGAKPPQPKFGGSGGQRPPAKTETILNLDTVLPCLLF